MELGGFVTVNASDKYLKERFVKIPCKINRCIFIIKIK